MKKIILLALAALIMFAMVSCDGTINSEISGDTQKTITFHVYGDYYTFEGGASKLVMDVPSGCETWEDWINKGCTVNVYYNLNDFWECNLMKANNDYAYFGENNEPFIFITEDGLKSMYPENTVKLDDNIKDGGSYTLNVFDL